MAEDTMSVMQRVMLEKEQDSLFLQMIERQMQEGVEQEQQAEPHTSSKETIPLSSNFQKTVKLQSFAEHIAHLKADHAKAQQELKESYGATLQKLHQQKTSKFDFLRKGAAQKLLGQSKRSKVAALHKQYQKESKRLQAGHDSKVHAAIAQELDRLFAKLDHLFVSAKPTPKLLGLTGAVTSVDQVNRALANKKLVLKKIATDFELVAAEDLFEQVLQDPLYKDQRFASLYGKHEEVIAELDQRIQASADVLIDYLTQQHNLQTATSLERLYGFVARPRACSERELVDTYNHLLQDIAIYDQVSALEQDFIEAKNRINAVKSLVIQLHRAVMSVKTHAKKDWQLLSLSHADPSIKDIDIAYNKKKRQIEKVASQLHSSSVSKGSYLYKIIAEELDKVERARSFLTRQAHERLQNIQELASKPQSVKVDKALLALAKASNVSDIAAAHDKALYQLRGSDLAPEDIKLFERRLSAAHKNLTKMLSELRKPRALEGLSNWQLLSLPADTVSLSKVVHATEHKLRELKDLKVLYQDQPDTAEQRAMIKQIDVEISEVYKASDFVQKKMHERLYAMQHVAAGDDVNRDMKLLGDVTLPLTKQSVLHAFNIAMQTVDGAGTYLSDHVVVMIKDKLHEAKDRLLASLGHHDRASVAAKSSDQRKYLLIDTMPDRLQNILMPQQQQELIAPLLDVAIPENVRRNDQVLDKTAMQLLRAVMGDQKVLEILQEPAVKEALEDEWQHSSLQDAAEVILKAVGNVEVKKENKQAYAGLIAWAITASNMEEGYEKGM